MCQNAARQDAMTEAASSRMLDRNMTTAHADTATTDAQESSPRYAGWRVVLACYLAAVFCWGFGLYGHGVYLTELHRLHGWPTALISGRHHRLLSAHRGAGGVRQRCHRAGSGRGG